MMISPIKNRINNKGITLVEVLVTLAVLSIMAVPIFNTFMESMKINQKTMTTVSANHIGQKVLEILKADGEIDGFTAHDSLANTFIGSMDGYDITYTLSDITGLTYAPDDTTRVDYGADIKYDEANVTLIYSKDESDNKSYFSSYGNKYESTWCLLKFEKGTSAVDVTFAELDNTGNVVNSVKRSEPLGEDTPLKVVVKVVGEPIKARLNLENTSANKILVYEVDDTMALLRTVPKLASDAGDLELYRNARSTSADADNSKSVYEVDVKISKNSDVLEELLGTIVK